MDLQTRKISFIQEFPDLQNEHIISQLEKLLKNEKRKIANDKLQTMSLDEFNERIDKSLKDTIKGRLTESDKLTTEIEIIDIFDTRQNPIKMNKIK